VDAGEHLCVVYCMAAVLQARQSGHGTANTYSVQQLLGIGAVNDHTCSSSLTLVQNGQLPSGCWLQQHAAHRHPPLAVFRQPALL
jgi:hypothetical protein